jgi:E3 ubiquitin-protein ligase MARCH6
LFNSFSKEDKLYVLRMIYPFTAGWAVWTWVGLAVARATNRWRSRIKDEVYLIGERLHNFGEASRKALSDQKGVSAGPSHAVVA